MKGRLIALTVGFLILAGLYFVTQRQDSAPSVVTQQSDPVQNQDDSALKGMKIN